MDNETYWSPWATGWSAFAAIMLIVIGAFHSIVGLTSIFDDQFYLVSREWILEFDSTVWGWIHLIGGILVILAGVGIFSGNVAARAVGVAVAIVSAIISFAWLPYSPATSSLMIAIAVAVIWSLTVHGLDLADAHKYR